MNVTYSQTVITNLNGDNVSFTEGGSAVLIDNGSNATVTDDGAGYDTGNITVTISGATSNDDLLIVTGSGVELSDAMNSGSTVTVSGTVIGAIAVNGTGQNGENLVITLNSSADDTFLGTLIHNLTYTNDSDDPPSSRSLILTITNTTPTTSDNAVITVSITGVNDAPTLTATGINPTFTEDASAADIFSTISISTIEAGQTITELILTVTNVYNGADEILYIDGSDVALTDGNSLTTSTNSMSVVVSLTGNTATVTISEGTGISSAAAQTLVDGITYKNENNTPNTSNRVVTLTSIKDNGGTANSGSDTTILSIASTVTVVAANDQPVLTVTPNDPTFTEGDPAVDLFSGVSFSAPETGQNIVELVFRLNNVENGMDEILSVDGSDVGLGIGDSVITTNHTMKVMVTNNDTTDTWSYVTITDTLTSTVGFSPGVFQDVIENLTYRNASSAIHSSNRKIVIFSAKDDGGTANGGVDFVSYIDSTTVTIIGVNDRPVLNNTKSPEFNGVPENISDPANGSTLYSTLVSVLIDDAGTFNSNTLDNYSDGDGDQPGMAVTGVNANGTLWYSTDDGSTWTELTGIISETSALTVYANNSTRLYYKPDNGVSGTVTDAITFKAWDRTSAGTNGATGVNTTLTTAFSLDNDDAGITVAEINYAPTLTATALNPSFTEGGTAVDLFSTVDAETPEAGQLFIELQITVENVLNGGDEILLIDGSQIQLTNGNSVITSTNSMTVDVSISGFTATLVITKVGGVGEAIIESVIDGITYKNLSNNPGSANRTVKLSSLKDDGGSANGSDTGTYSITSVITIEPINEPPVISNLNGDNSFVIAAGTAAYVDVNQDAIVTNGDSPENFGGSIQILQTSGTANGSWSFDGSVVKSGADGIIVASESVSVNGIIVGSVSPTDDGASGNTLIISLDENSTNTRIGYLVNYLKYSVPAVLGDRSFTLTLDDGDGNLNGGDPTDVVSFTVTVTQNPPVLSGLNGDSRNYVKGSVLILDENDNAAVTDSDSPNFDTGNLTVSVSSGLNAAEDELVINTSGLVSLSAGMAIGSNVLVEAVIIGTISSTGNNGNDLIINLNSNSTHSRVNLLLRAIAYYNSNSGSPSVVTRFVDFSIQDASGVGSAVSEISRVEIILNNRPTTTEIPDLQVPSNAANSNIDLSQYFDDVEDGATGLIYSVQNVSNASLFTSVFISGHTLVLDYGLSTNGTSDITIRATDAGGFYIESTFRTTVGTGINTETAGLSIIVNTGGTVIEGGTLYINSQMLAAETANGSSASLIYNITQMPRHGSLDKTGSLLKTSQVESFPFTQEDLNEGKVKYTHDGSEVNSDTIKFIVSDENDNSSSENSFVITITNVNDPPVVRTLNPILMFEDDPYTFSVTDWYNKIDDPDDADSTLSITITCDDENITLSTNDNKTYRIIPSENYFGSALFCVIVSDGELSNTTETQLIVQPVNDLPEIIGLEEEITLTNGKILKLPLYDFISDLETPDSLLRLSFSITPDSVLLDYKRRQGVLTLFVYGSFVGNADLSITVIDEDGGSSGKSVILHIIAEPTGLEKIDGMPTEFVLFHNYPNPFNPSTVIRYGIPESGHVKLVVYDILGNEVSVLVNQEQSPGYYEKIWDASNYSSGIYFYLFNAGQFKEIKKMLLIK